MEQKTVTLPPLMNRPFTAPELARQTGSTASPVELLEFLTGYLGDHVFAKRFADCISMIRAKNADYSQGEHRGDRIAAFRRISHDIDVPMVKAWAVFCQKHWGAIMRFVKDGITESEPIDGRINDIINYMVLLGAIVDDMRASDEISEGISR